MVPVSLLAVPPGPVSDRTKSPHAYALDGRQDCRYDTIAPVWDIFGSH